MLLFFSAHDFKILADGQETVQSRARVLVESPETIQNGAGAQADGQRTVNHRGQTKRPQGRLQWQVMKPQ